MSWQAYIESMAESGADMSAICGKNCSVWAASANFNPAPDEVAVLVEALDKKDGSIYATGVRLGGKKWAVIRVENDSDVIVLKGKENSNQKQNMIVAASNTALVMGANVVDDIPAGTVRVSVERLRDYLKSSQY